MCLLHLLSLHYQDEMTHANHGSSKPSTPTKQRSVSKSGTAASLNEGGSKANTPTSSQVDNSQSDSPASPHICNSEGTTALSRHDGSYVGQKPGLSAPSADVAMGSVDRALREDEASEGFNKNLDFKRDKPEGSKNIAAMQEGHQDRLGFEGQESALNPPKSDGTAAPGL